MGAVRASIDARPGKIRHISLHIQTPVETSLALLSSTI